MNIYSLSLKYSLTRLLNYSLILKYSLITQLRYLLRLTYSSFALGVSDTRTRLIVRQNILYPGNPLASLKTRHENDYEKYFYTLLGVTAVLLIFIAIIFLVGIFYYTRR